MAQTSPHKMKTTGPLCTWRHHGSVPLYATHPEEGLRKGQVNRYDRGDDNAKSNPKADTVRLLIEHGADAITLDKTHSTALHLAASFGSSETVRLLLEHGADVSMLDENKKTPLHLAISPVSTHC